MLSCLQVPKEESLSAFPSPYAAAAVRFASDVFVRSDAEAGASPKNRLAGLHDAAVFRVSDSRDETDPFLGVELGADGVRAEDEGVVVIHH